MPVSILRWKGGSGGDMIMKNILTKHYVVNMQYRQIADDGKIEEDNSWFDWYNLTELQKIIVYSKYSKKINLQKLIEEIEIHKNRPDFCWIKSHYYQTDIFNDITVDLVVDPDSLPFAVGANIKKTQTMILNFNPLVKKIVDPKIKIKYAMYCVAVDLLTKEKNLSNQIVYVSNLISGPDNAKKVLNNYKIELNSNFVDVYNQWFEKNLKYMPSTDYQQCILQGNYDYQNTKLCLAERYSLLALSQNKFKILPD